MFWKIISLMFTASIIVEANQLHHDKSHMHLQKRALVTNICETLNTTNRVQCYCIQDKKDAVLIASADCYLTKQNVAIDDRIWSAFKTLGHVPKITLLNTRGIPMTYIPTAALKETTALKKLDVKYGLLNTIGSYAFANLSLLQEITLRDNQIVKLDEHAFIHHRDLKIINLDTNSLSEINRNVFVDLPSLEKLFLTNNQISTIHDKAFINLDNLRELEIDRNKIFSLNFAVFEGLKNLEKLDLSENSLEVIGDNTFQALENLQMLNLAGNSIQMLDEKAFYGLGKMRSLSLAHNKLTEIDNVIVFAGLESLISLSLKGNQLKDLKEMVMTPILGNFYGNNSNLDVEDNEFPCDCRLDWFTSLMNKTLNNYLHTALENLKCTPDAPLREAWTNAEKNAPPADEEIAEDQGKDYEYYDDSQLNGKFFYIDVRDLLKCDNATDKSPTTVRGQLTKDEAIDKSSTTVRVQLTKDITSPISTTLTVTTHKTTEELPIAETANTGTTTQKIEKLEMHTRMRSEVNKQEEFTTTRLATVSAKPVEAKIYENMASDEAKPDRIKAHRSVQEDNHSRRAVDAQTGNANENLGSVKFLLLTVLICFRFNI